MAETAAGKSIQVTTFKSMDRATYQKGKEHLYINEIRMGLFPSHPSEVLEGVRGVRIFA